MTQRADAEMRAVDLVSEVVRAATFVADAAFCRRFDTGENLRYERIF